MLHHHKKADRLFRNQWHKIPCQPNLKKEQRWELIDAPISGQFGLDKDIFDPLKTPTDMPIQAESVTSIQEDILDDSIQSNVVMESEDCMLDETDNIVSIMSSSQEKR